jgi:hypothetical protein
VPTFKSCFAGEKEENPQTLTRKTQRPGEKKNKKKRRQH